MRDLVIQPTALAQWHTLVNEAEFDSNVQLGEELESYLVFLLMRFLQRPEFCSRAVAMEFLESLHRHGGDRTRHLQEVGDKCLLYAGLFPDQVQRRRVNESYYIDLGQNAYYALASESRLTLAELFQHLCECFESLSHVLKAMRQKERVNLKTTGTVHYQTNITKH